MGKEDKDKTLEFEVEPMKEDAYPVRITISRLNSDGEYEELFEEKWDQPNVYSTGKKRLEPVFFPWLELPIQDSKSHKGAKNPWLRLYNTWNRESDFEKEDRLKKWVIQRLITKYNFPKKEVETQL